MSKLMYIVDFVFGQCQARSQTRYSRGGQNFSGGSEILFRGAKCVQMYLVNGKIQIL